MTVPTLLKLSFSAAMEIAQREWTRLGLTATHRMSALYASVDRRADGAAFAVILLPLTTSKRVGKKGKPGTCPEKLKLLIHDDGRTTLQALPAH